MKGLEAAFPRHARRLQQRVLHTDMWIKATTARGHGVSGDESILGHPILRAVIGHSLLHRINQFFGRWPEIRAARAGGIVAICSRGRWSGMKIFRTDEILPKQF